MQNSSGNFKHGVSYVWGKNREIGVGGGKGVNDKEKTRMGKKRDKGTEEEGVREERWEKGQSDGERRE